MGPTALQRTVNLDRHSVEKELRRVPIALAFGDRGGWSLSLLAVWISRAARTP